MILKLTSLNSNYENSQNPYNFFLITFLSSPSWSDIPESYPDLRNSFSLSEELDILIVMKVCGGLYRKFISDESGRDLMIMSDTILEKVSEKNVDKVLKFNERLLGISSDIIKSQKDLIALKEILTKCGISDLSPVR